VIEFLDTKFADIFAYSFTAGMENDLDIVAAGEKNRTDILQNLWDSMKVRVAEAKSSSSGSGNAIRDFGNGITIANTKKGILLIKKTGEVDSAGKEKVEFASMPSSADPKTMTAEEAVAVFTKKAGNELGTLEDMPVLLKMGPFGQYVEWNLIRMPYKEEIDFEELCQLLKVKEAGSQDTDPSIQSFIREVGDYTIKKGPFRLYFFRGGAAVKKNVKFPAELDPVTVGAAALAEAFNAAPAPGGGGRGRGGFRGRGRGRGRGQ